MAWPPGVRPMTHWLQDVGFENVECFHKLQELAIFGGQRPGG
jgi:hypothetical protein